MYSNNLQMQEATGLKYNQVLILPIPLPLPSHKLLGLGDWPVRQTAVIRSLLLL